MSSDPAHTHQGQQSEYPSLRKQAEYKTATVPAQPRILKIRLPHGRRPYNRYMGEVPAEVIEKLKGISTATVSTCLYRRGLRNQYVQGVLPVGDPKPTTMVGPAFTLRYIPAREDLNGLEVFRNPDHPQRKAVEICPPGAVLVMDSRKDPRAASAGSILIGRLQARGVAGVVTDGGFRDAGDIAALRIPAFHQRPSAPTNLTLHEAIDINVPIGCGDAPVFPGDIMMGDCDGVVVIPAHLAAEVAEEAAEMTVFEDFVAEEVSKGRSIRGLYPATDPKTLEDFKAWRKERNR